ncbi:hypothetical protein [Nodosilinea sp. P-1105]|uniref:hypothetical protein n=1 Tax=Nodosilinea sp. P-1105 TaxID=2546229 RepID=UPI00146BEE18|nr:hypothetical protein [Nodosilinea sp. P-1105]NMF82966.1 hypothetical protein [Nodosilinea sp. P-1105]
MGLTVQQIQTRLARGQFEALFRDDLGWAAPEAPDLPPDLPGSVRVLARRETAAVILVTGATAAGEFPWSAPSGPPSTGPALVEAFTPAYPDPLVIWQDAAGQRCLWYWRGSVASQAHWRTHSGIVGVGSLPWATKLLRLQADRPATPLYKALNTLEVTPTPAQVQEFLSSWQSLGQALGAIPQAADRHHYAVVLLARLIALVALQRRGFLAADEWYLHNQFGQSQQRGADRFFQDILQPLCHQGLGLPLEERSRLIQQQLGPLPFLPTGPFTPGDLDRRWGQLPLGDRAFEPALTWLGDLAPDTATPLVYQLRPLLEAAVNQHSGTSLITPEPGAWALCDRTLKATLLDWAEPLLGYRPPSLENLWLSLSPAQAGALLQRLGQITVLDPACGSGRYLGWGLEQLMALAQILIAIADLDHTAAVPDWVQPSPLALYGQFAGHSLYGLDLWPPAVELARLGLWLTGVAYSQAPEDLARLPDLSLTLLQGNALIGLVRVDSERFDQIPAKGRRSANHAPPLQGNLLQPLLADTYQSVLAERQVRLEHYRSQTRLLAEAGSVPTYAQADFLRDRLDDLNRIAQDKLTHLLWSEGSQQLSIRVADSAGSRQTRPLAIADVEAVNPFHWGFYFHDLLRDRISEPQADGQGGFDIILSHFPGGTVQPTATEFIDLYQDLFQAKGVAPSTFLHNHPQVLAIAPDLATAWDHYRGQFALPDKYFRRSGQYPCAAQSQGRLYWSRLFLERAVQLLRPGGRCGVMLDPFWAKTNSAPLRHWLERHTTLEAVVDLSNQQGLWPDVPGRTALCLLWLQRQGPTTTCPYSAHSRVANALAPEALGAALQRLIHLTEKGR